MKVSLQISSCPRLLLFMHNWCRNHKEHVSPNKSQHLGNKDDGVNRRKGHRGENAPGLRFTLWGEDEGRLFYPHTHLYTEGYSKLVTQETTDPLLLYAVDVTQHDTKLMFQLLLDVNVC